ncbi:uncharacterized protein [Procambarus clarkii]|uniref:uncharacterized protein n=1 Tax=Procambarus clarkii TaxID=6728 RepID=UPI0037423AE2
MAFLRKRMICCKALMVLALVVMISQTPGGDSCYLDQADGEATGDLDQVGLIVTQVLVHNFPGCHLVLLTLSSHSRTFPSVLRHLSAGGKAGIVVEVGSVVFQDQLARDHLLQQLWGDTRTTCRTVFLDLTASNATTAALEFINAASLWKESGTGVVALGRSAGVREVLLHHSLRNTLHALYLALHHHTFNNQAGSLTISKALRRGAVGGGAVWVYRRCLYCNMGDADVQLVRHCTLPHCGHHSPHLLQEQVRDLMGRQFRVVALRHFPFMDYQAVSQEPGSTILPTDCLDNRFIQTLAAKLNFTYTMHEQREKEWGVPTAGVFDGMIGELQREETDFCMIAAPTPERLQAAEFARGYPSTQLVIVSLSPSLVPEYLSFIRPFAGELWGALLVSVVAWGVSLWFFQKAWQWVAGGRSVDITTALLYGWGTLLNQPPSDPSISISGQAVYVKLLIHWRTTDIGDVCINDASNTSHPNQIRALFAIILTTGSPSSPTELWEKYKSHMAEDIIRQICK